MSFEDFVGVIKRDESVRQAKLFKLDCMAITYVFPPDSVYGFTPYSKEVMITVAGGLTRFLVSPDRHSGIIMAVGWLTTENKFTLFKVTSREKTKENLYIFKGTYLREVEI